MAFECGKAGVTASERTALDRMSRWDEEEDVTVNADDLSLTVGVLGDGNAGVGSGASRGNYLAFGLHNTTSSQITIVYNTIKGGNDKNYTVAIPAGGWAMPLVQITKIKGTGSGTSGAKIKVLYKDKYAIAGTGAIQGITE